MSIKLRRDDEVIVIGGKDRGKSGRVLRVDPKRERVYVEGDAYEPFVGKVVEKVRALRQGAPGGPAQVDIGLDGGGDFFDLNAAGRRVVDDRSSQACRQRMEQVFDRASRGVFH